MYISGLHLDWPQDHFGPKRTLAQGTFGPRNTSAPIILWPDVWMNFGELSDILRVVF